jgi:hypothetical protein
VATEKTKWFYKTRGSYIPKTWPGWLTYIPYLAYLIGVVAFVLRRHDSFWLALFTVVPNFIAAGIILSWIAKRKS